MAYRPAYTEFRHIRVSEGTGDVEAAAVVVEEEGVEARECTLGSDTSKTRVS
jgi:hypothetical protein